MKIRIKTYPTLLDCQQHHVQCFNTDGYWVTFAIAATKDLAVEIKKLLRENGSLVRGCGYLFPV